LPLVIGGIYIFWRFMILPHMSNADDTYIHLVNVSVSTISFRYLRGLIVFILNWLGPVLSVGLGNFILDELNRHYVVAIFIIGLVIIGFSIYFVRRFGISSWKKVFIWGDRNRNLYSLLVIFLVGGLFWAAGYVPVITIYSPNFGGMGTRDSLFASAGASLALVASISILICLIDKSLKNVRTISIISIIPLLILGSLYQLSAQRENFSAWDKQKQFWSAMFKAIPGLKKNTEVVIIIPGYSHLGEFQILPFSGNWEAEAALSVLYNDSSLNAVYYYPDRSKIEDNFLKSAPNWSNYIFVYYDPTKSTLKIVQDPEKELSLSFQVSGYNPDKRIVTRSLQSESYRWLVR
jgi:hypothetical protein